MSKRTALAEFNVPSFLSSNWQCSTNRAIFISYDDYIGLGPHDFKRGDCVCIVFSDPLPIIVRFDEKTDQLNKRFEIIGDAYTKDSMEVNSVTRCVIQPYSAH